MGDDSYSVKAAAAALGVSRERIRQLRKAGVLPNTRTFSETDIAKAREARRQPRKPGPLRGVCAPKNTCAATPDPAAAAPAAGDAPPPAPPSSPTLPPAGQGSAPLRSPKLHLPCRPKTPPPPAAHHPAAPPPAEGTAGGGNPTPQPGPSWGDW